MATRAVRRHGVIYEVSPRTKSDIYRDVLPLLNSRRIELLDHARLISQLTQLEGRTSRAGRDLIDHPPGSHDDLANAACGALLAAQAANKHRLRTVLMTSADLLCGGIEVDPITLRPLNDERRASLVRDREGILRIVNGENGCWAAEDVRERRGTVRGSY